MFGWIEFQLGLFLRVQATIGYDGSDNGSLPDRWQAIILTNDNLVYWYIYIGHPHPSPLSSKQAGWPLLSMCICCSEVMTTHVVSGCHWGPSGFHMPLRDIHTGGNRTKLPSSRWRRRGRSLREVFTCSCLFATTDLSQIYNRETQRHCTPCTKTTDSYLFSFWYNDPRKIRRETTVGKFVPNNGRR